MATFQSEVDALDAIKAHALCADFMETPQKFVVFYPDPYKVPGGAAVDRAPDDLTALNLLYDRLEDFWNAQRLQVSAQ